MLHSLLWYDEQYREYWKLEIVEKIISKLVYVVQIQKKLASQENKLKTVLVYEIFDVGSEKRFDKIVSLKWVIYNWWQESVHFISE